MKKSFYKTELHCHTSEGSLCARENAKDTVEKYLEYGFTSVALTNHMQSYRIWGDEPYPYAFPSYEAYVDYCYDAIDAFRQAADGRLYVLNGFEMHNPYSGNDYLVYGLSREVAKGFNIPKAELRDATKYIRDNGGVIIQAHPMREGMTIVPPAEVDGYEIFNNSKGWLYTNPITCVWSAINCHDKFKILTAGNDHHNPEDKPTAGILTSEPITTDEELVRVLKNKEFTIFHEPVLNC